LHLIRRSPNAQGALVLTRAKGHTAAYKPGLVTRENHAAKPYAGPYYSLPDLYDTVTHARGGHCPPAWRAYPGTASTARALIERQIPAQHLPLLQTSAAANFQPFGAKRAIGIDHLGHSICCGMRQDLGLGQPNLNRTASASPHRARRGRRIRGVIGTTYRCRARPVCSTASQRREEATRPSHQDRNSW